MEDLLSDDPSQIGDYPLIARIGSGGMGQVFLAQSQGGRPLAIKVIRPELAGDRRFRKRFSQEVALARAVNGLYTALVVDADTDGPAPWLATVYVPGPSLAEAIDEHGPLPVESVRTLAAGLAESLKAIHAAGIVHRDLKPSNVLLAEDGPRVIDFGIARALESVSLTASGVVVGTVAFMSPEQVQGGPVGAPSDIFSLGSVLVFAATGEGPFGTGTTSAMLYRVVHNAPDISRVPEQLRSLINRCFARHPSDRPNTAELLAELSTARPAMNWLPPGLTRKPGQEQRDQDNTAHQETQTVLPAQVHPENSRSAARSRQRAKSETATIHKDLRVPAEANLSTARPPARVGNFPSLPKVTFKEPFPWAAFLWSFFLACWIGGWIVLAIVGFDRGSGAFYRITSVDIIFAFIGFIVMTASALGLFGDKIAPEELFYPRAKLVISASGIRYRWSLVRQIRCDWDEIVKIRVGTISRDSNSAHMIIGVGASQAHFRDIVLCPLDYSPYMARKFPRDEIRTAIASFEPSLLDRTWGHD